MTQYDYIVIGAGSAGCVIANRLTQDSDTTVLLLEAGNPDTKPEIQIPAQCLSLLGSDVDWGYRLVVIPGGPHAINWTHADQVNPVLLDFLKGN